MTITATRKLVRSVSAYTAATGHTEVMPRWLFEHLGLRPSNVEGVAVEGSKITVMLYQPVGDTGSGQVVEALSAEEIFEREVEQASARLRECQERARSVGYRVFEHERGADYYGYHVIPAGEEPGAWGDYPTLAEVEEALSAIEASRGTSPAVKPVTTKPCLMGRFAEQPARRHRTGVRAVLGSAWSLVPRDSDVWLRSLLRRQHSANDSTTHNAKD